MNGIETAITEYGQSLGLKELRFNRQGIVCLRFEHLGNFFIEMQPERVLLYLVREVPHAGLEVLKRALQLCHFRNGHAFEIRAGMKGESQLAFLTELPNDQVTTPILDTVLNQLVQLHDQL